VGVRAILAPQRLIENPDRVRRFELAMVLSALQLLAVKIGPAVKNARGEIREDQQLDLDLEQSARRIAGLDVDDGQLVLFPILIRKPPGRSVRESREHSSRKNSGIGR
jgi:hypothetical protein